MIHRYVCCKVEVRFGETSLWSVGSIAEDAKRLGLDAEGARGCIDGLASDCGLVRRMSEVNFSTYGLAPPHRGGVSARWFQSAIKVLPCRSCPLPYATSLLSTSLPLTMQISQRQLGRHVDTPPFTRSPLSFRSPGKERYYALWVTRLGRWRPHPCG